MCSKSNIVVIAPFVPSRLFSLLITIGTLVEYYVSKKHNIISGHRRLFYPIKKFAGSRARLLARSMSRVFYCLLLYKVVVFAIDRRCRDGTLNL